MNLIVIRCQQTVKSTAMKTNRKKKTPTKPMYALYVQVFLLRLPSKIKHPVTTEQITWHHCCLEGRKVTLWISAPPLPPIRHKHVVQIPEWSSWRRWQIHCFVNSTKQEATLQNKRGMFHWAATWPTRKCHVSWWIKYYSFFFFFFWSTRLSSVTVFLAIVHFWRKMKSGKKSIAFWRE